MKITGYLKIDCITEEWGFKNCLPPPHVVQKLKKDSLLQNILIDLKFEKNTSWYRETPDGEVKREGCNLRLRAKGLGSLTTAKFILTILEPLMITKNFCNKRFWYSKCTPKPDQLRSVPKIAPATTLNTVTANTG